MGLFFLSKSSFAQNGGGFVRNYDFYEKVRQMLGESGKVEIPQDVKQIFLRYGLKKGINPNLIEKNMIVVKPLFNKKYTSKDLKLYLDFMMERYGDGTGNLPAEFFIEQLKVLNAKK
jgi:hypothetical protein